MVIFIVLAIVVAVMAVNEAPFLLGAAQTLCEEESQQ